MLRGDGGYNGPSGTTRPAPEEPGGEPDRPVAVATRPEQALLYRLNGDPNPLHLDRVYARERDLPDVVQQGPLNETFLYRFVTDWLHKPWDLRRTKVRFAGNAFPDDMLTCRGTITRTYRSDTGEPRVDCQIWQENQNGERILSGEASFTLPEKDGNAGRC